MSAVSFVSPLRHRRPLGVVFIALLAGILVAPQISAPTTPPPGTTPAAAAPAAVADGSADATTDPAPDPATTDAAPSDPATTDTATTDPATAGTTTTDSSGTDPVAGNTAPTEPANPAPATSNTSNTSNSNQSPASDNSTGAGPAGTSTGSPKTPAAEPIDAAAIADPVSAKVVFRDTTGTVPAGYVRDAGAAYTEPSGMGWVTQASLADDTHAPIDGTRNVRTRACTTMPAEQRGLMHLQAPNPATADTTPMAWEYALPNGVYQVSVSVGDAQLGGDAESHVLHVEGVTAFNELPKPATGTGCATTDLHTTTVWTTVDDGRLTIDAIGGTNTKLNFVTIDSASVGNLTAVGSSTAVTLDWDDVADAPGYRIWRSDRLPVVTTGTPLATPDASTFVDGTAVKGQLYYYAVATAAGAGSAMAAGMADDPTPATLALPAKINFQAAGATPAGYLADTGQNYANLRGYGWVSPGTQDPVDLSGNGRIRPAQSGVPATLTSTMHMQGNQIISFYPGDATHRPVEGSWQLAVPNGSYDVEVAVGDSAPGSDPTTHVINVEGQNVITKAMVLTPAPAGDDRFVIATKTVVVDDGFLTVDADGGTNTKIDYLVVAQTPADPPPAAPTGLAATAGDGSVALSWTANAEPDLAGYNVFRSTAATVPTSGTPLNGTTLLTTPSYTDTTAANNTSYHYVVVAVDEAAQASAASAVATAKPDATDPALAPLPLFVNFTTKTADPFPGYTADYGEPFTNTVGRGWVQPGTSTPRNIVGNGRLRAARTGVDVSLLQRGLMHMQPQGITNFDGVPEPASYEIAVPNGSYDVTVSAGDQPGSTVAGCPAPCYDSVHGIVVEGAGAIHDFQATAAKEFDVNTVTVLVDDGRLTIAADGTNTKINYLTVAAADVTAPGVPADVTTTAGDGSVTLNWSAVAAADLKGYQVYRSTESPVELTSANRLTADPITATTLTDTAVANGTRYHYVITSIDTTGNESAASDAVEAQPADATAPAGPVGLVAIAGDTEAVLRWTPNIEPDLANYRIYRSTSTPVAIDTDTFVGTAAAAEFTSTGLINGSTYYFAVTAIDAAGNESALSGEKSVVPTAVPDLVAPAAPANLTAVAGDHRVSLAWDANTEDDVATYQIQRSATGGSGYTQLATVPAGHTDYVDTDAANGAQYYYVVTATDLAGNVSAISNEASATPADATAPAVPVGLTATAGIQRIVLTWTPNTEPDLRGYRIHRLADPTDEPGDDNLIGILIEPGRTFVDADLTAGTRYYYAIVSYDRTGNLSAATAVVDAVPDDTPDTTAPDAPAGLAATVSDGAVTLSWTAVTAADLAGYTVYRSDTATGSRVKLTNTLGVGTSFVDTSATPGATSYYVVTAVDKAGNESTASDQVSADVPASGIDVKFSFQPDSAPAITGYTKELGAAYTDARGYGWVTQASLGSATHVPLDLTANTRLRTRTAPVTALQNRLIHMQYDTIVPLPTNNGTLTSGAWEYAVPAGRYTVTASVGDQPGGAKTGCAAPCYDSLHTVRAEGTALIDKFQPTAAAEYSTGTATVDVTDGRLTVDAIGGSNTKINWVSIVGAGPVAPDTTAPGAPVGLTAIAGDGTATLSWGAPGDPDVVGYNVYRSSAAEVQAVPANKQNTALLTANTFTDAGLTNGTTYHYAVTAADAAGNESVLSTPVPVTPDANAADSVHLKVNFADAATAPPTGYVTDFGQAFGPRTGPNQGAGNTYGWVKIGTSTPVSIEGNGRNRNTGTPSANQPDPRLATMIHTQLPTNATDGVHQDATWEYAVPNGIYQVTVAVGDAGTAVDSSHWLNIENQNAIAAFVPSSTGKFATASRTVAVTDGRLTLSPTGGTNTKIDYVDIDSVDRDGRPYTTAVTPANLATNVVDNTSIATDNNLNATVGAVDATTLGGGNVTLTRVVDGANIPGTGATSGGGDTISFLPAEPLEGGVLYRFSVTSGAKDVSGRAFLPFSSVFTTANGSGTGGDLSSVAFDKTDSGAGLGKSYTSLVIGPDGKLYAGSIYGQIYRWTINADGTLSGMQTIDTVRTHASAKGWEGAPNRTVIGLAFDPASTADNPILWITDNYAYLGSDVPDFTGSIARLTGPNLENYQEIVVNLPRSIKDHETNSIAFKDGKLLITQGSMNAMGAREGTWRRDEHLMSAAMLQLDPAKLPASLPVDAATPDMAVPARGGVPAHTGSYSPYTADAPVTLYATGIRNAFDLVVHSNGRVYAGTNGSAAGGATPASPASYPASCANRPDGGYSGPAVPAIANNQQAETDYLFDIHQGKYYGHPNPMRCEYVLNAGNPAGYTGNPLFKVNGYPLGQLADPNYDLAHVHDAGLHASANGTIEYQNTVAFGGALAGKVIVVRYSANQEIVAFNVTAGGSVSAPITGITGFTGFRQPLDIAQDATTGNLYVSELTDNPATTGIKLLKPQGGGSAAKVQASQRLVFTDVKGGAAAAPKSVSVKNIGGLPLVISAATIAGTDAALFTRSGGPALPVTVAPGTTVTFPVTFAATAAGPRGANLILTSNDPSAPTTSVTLRGLGTDGLGGSAEPSLQWILDTLQIPVDVGDPDKTDNVMPDTSAAIGDEVLIPSFSKLLFDRAVGITPLSLFGPAGPAGNPNVAVLAAHSTADPSARTVLFNGPNTSNQTVLPEVNTVGEYDLDAPFGFDVTWPGLSNRVTYSEDALNTWSAAAPHKVRVYPMKNPDGSAVLGSYIVAPEDVPSGVDFQDAAFVVSNVKPTPTAGAGKITVSPAELVFSGVKGTSSAARQVVVSNNGSTPLQLASVTVAGTNPGSFTVTGGAPQSVAAGETATLSVTFTPGSSTVGPQSATLRIDSDDAATPRVEVGLHGLATNGEQGNNEPPLKSVVDVLGYPINVGGSGLILGVDPRPIGDEVPAPLFTKAGAEPVTMTPVARYSPDELLPFGWYSPNTGDPVTHELATIGLGQEQTLNPQIVAGGDDSFDPGATAFGFYVDSHSFNRKSYTQDSLNTGTPHAVRSYPAKNRAGELLPNTYLVTFEDASNGDYQDYVFVVTGVEPVGGASTGVPVARIDFQPASSTVSPGYTADTGAPYTAARGFGWVQPGTSTPYDMTAQTRDRAGSTEARLRTLILLQPTAAQAPGGPGAWQYQLPNGTYTVTVGVGDPGYTDSTHRVQVEGQTAIPGFVPTSGNLFATGTVTVQVTDGMLTVDALGGDNTKLTYLEIYRPDTAPDTTDPTVSVDISGLQAAAGVYRNSATITATATDAGSGVSGISYSLDDGPFQPYTDPVQVTAPGSHTVRARAADVAGNVATSAAVTFSVVTADAGRPVLSLENPEGVPYPDRLVMSRIQNPQTGSTCRDAANCDPVTGPFFPANVVHDTASLVIRNTGIDPLNVTSLAVTGPFTLVDPPTLPTMVAVDDTLTLQVRFTATTNGAGNGLWTGALTIGSDDPARPSVPVELAGFWQSVSEGGQEPSLPEMGALFGYTTAFTAAGDALNQHGAVHASGDEVLSPYWLRADSSKPISVRQLAAYHTQGNTATLFWHPKTSGSATSIVTHAGADGQSILPHRNGSATAPAAGTFSPTGAFGLRIDGEWSDPTRNNQAADQANGCVGECGHHLRVWTVRDRSGAVVPDTWLVGMDYSGINYDYNDNLYLISNMKPEAATDPASPALLPGAAALMLNFDQAVAGTLADATGQGSGFVSTQPNKLDVAPGSNSYDPTRLHLAPGSPGTLTVDSAGSAAAGTNGSADNTLVNGLQLPFDASGGTFSVTARTLGPVTELNAGSEQQAIMFGADQDNYVKVAAIHKSGAPSIEFYNEIGGTGTTIGTAVPIPSPGTVADLDLALIGNPAAGTVRAGYRINGGAWVVLPTAWTAPAAAVGKIFGTRTGAGILVSNKGGTAFSATYDSFAVVDGDLTTTAVERAALYRLDVGGSAPFVDAKGRTWAPDSGRFSPTTAVAEGATTTPSEIQGTDDDPLYRTYRGNVGNVPQADRVLRYELPSLGAATVDLRLHFAERAAGNNAAGKRVFDIEVEGATVRRNFDIFAAAGGQNTATVLPIDNVTITGGRLNLALRASVDYPSIAAIEVLCHGACPVPDDTAPATPTGLKSASGNAIKLSWTANDEPDLMGYRVYRSTSQTGPFTAVGPALVTDPTFTDGTAPAGSTLYYQVRAIDSSENHSAASATLEVEPPLPPSIRINTGGPAQAVGGTSWSACSSSTACSGWVSGGNAYSESDTVTGVPSGMNNTIFQTEWTGGQSTAVGAKIFGYAVPVANGPYLVRLHFAELNKTAKGTRLFDVKLEDSTVLSNFDIWAEAGGIDKAIAVDFPVAITDGVVNLDFVKRVENAKISAIEIIAVAPDAVAPAVVTGVKATGAGSGITVDWSPSTADDVVGYQVYRSASATGAFSKVTPNPVRGTGFVDIATAEGATAYYRVTAIDSSGNESDVSATVNATRPDTTAPAVVTGLTATGSATGVALKWTASTADDLAGYNVYRSATAGGSYAKVNSAPIAATSYQHSTAPEGTSYYRVTAIDKTGNESVASGTVDATRPPATATAVRINTGGPAQTVGGTSWTGCSSLTACNGWVSGGNAYSENDTVGGVPSGMTNAIFQTEWTGGQSTAVGAKIFGYSVPVVNGSYQVRLHFAELNKFAAKTRLFDVKLENTTVLSNFDIWTEAGGVDKAIVREFEVNVTDGVVNLDFIKRVENAKISAIEILPYTPDTTAPAVVTGLTANGSVGGIALNWNASTADDLAGYQLYRSATAGGPFSKVNSALITGSSYHHSTAPVGTSYYRITAIDKTGNESGVSGTVNATRPPATQSAVRINTGGPAQTVGGVSWTGCSSLTACNGWVTGGNAYSENDTITGVPSGMNNTTFQSEWTGGGSTAVGAKAFGFAVPVLNGNYQVRLHFAELNKFAAKTRLFDVKLENTTVLSNFDIWTEAGGPDKAIVRDFPVTVTDGVVNLDFIKRVEWAKISAIEIIPITAQATVRINSGGPAQTVGGVSWTGCSSLTACNGWVTGGNAYSENDTITGLPSGMNNTTFQSEWTGGGSTAVGAKAFGFAVPVLNGNYQVRLHFAELNKFAAKTRLFDVKLENTTVLSNFDIWTEAGGPDKAIVRDFPVTVTDGVVNLDFIKRVEWAKISAIEIIPTP